jgi:hypothetical protein
MIDSMRLLLTTLIFLLSLGAYANDNEATGKVEDSQKGASLEETEKKLDEIIDQLNTRLQNHTKLFKMKVSNQPRRTFLYKGKAEGENCVKAENQEAADNNCLKLEIFDFVGSEDGKTEQGIGSKYKYMTVFYDGSSSSEDPRKEAPRKVTKIISKVYVNNFVQKDLKLSDVVDEEVENKAHEKITIFFQHDGNPPAGTKESLSAIGYGKYYISGVENTKTNPLRNQFKKTYYIKHLDYFDKLLTYLFDANDQNGNRRYKATNEYLQNSLKY